MTVPDLRFFIKRCGSGASLTLPITQSAEKIFLLNGYRGKNDRGIDPRTTGRAARRQKEGFAVSIAIIVGLIVLFLLLAAKNNILRDVGPNPEEGRKPYSLALVQMAVWFFAIMTSWLLLYVGRHSFNTISDTLVLLMGISAGTGGGGVAIETNRPRSARQSQGFIKDIVSDGYGVSFHRFQIFAWTIVLVAVFIRPVTAYLTMPEFNSSLLVLRGISFGIYLGGKMTEEPAEKAGEKRTTSVNSAGND